MSLHFAILAFAAILAMGVLTWLCLPGTRHKSWAVLAFMVLAVMAFVAVIESAGQPRPYALEWRDLNSAPLIGFTWNEGKREVYVWLMRDGMPVAYALPWPKDGQKMGQLQDRWRRKGTTGEEFEFTADGDIARVNPPEPMLPKEPE